ncbi:MAG TPA: zinc ABC transporter substrate-binding protein [Phycisphaerales bacterium]|nr:zinc ABC transporter substrate-binding protein [Phycisphaerales bacterium]
MHRLFVLVAVVVAGVSAALAGEPLRVVATTGMVADLVRNVAGERAEVTGLMGSGVDPHLYKATRTDTAALMRADLVFYNGLMLEGKMSDALIRAATAGRKVYAVTELLDESDLLEPEEFEGQYDPHVWMDPSAWSRAFVVVRDKLTEADPAGAEHYRSNAERYAETLRELDEYAQRVLSSVPEERRVLVTAHDAFNYFGRRYGFEVVGIQGISTESEAGVRDIERIVGLIVSRRIPAVFVESTVSDRNVRALIDGARSRGWTVAIGGRLFSDAMGTPGTYEGTYLGMIDHNVTTIARALGGDAPERGMSGRLAVGE